MFSDEQLQLDRLQRFLTPMLPIAVGFLAVYGLGAWWFSSIALAGAAFAVLLYVVALVIARSWASKGEIVAPALLTGYALLLIVGLASPFIHFAGAALVIIPVTAAALVLGFVSGPKLKFFLLATFVVEVVVITFDIFLPPYFEQPPVWLQRVVTAAGVSAAAALGLRLLWQDSVRLRNAVQVRDEFLSVAAHELRTPLTAVNLTLESVAKRSAAGPVTTEWLVRQTQNTRRAVGRLTRLVEDLLDVSRIGAGRLEVTRVEMELGELAREVIERFASASPAPLTLVAETEVVGFWDRVKLDQVLVNLIGNALKYGEGKPVSVRVSEFNGRAVLCVKDEGIGIRPEAQDRVFERFHREASARNFGGLGLGLWITRSIVDAHGGDIRVSSEPGKGSTFTVELPGTLARRPAIAAVH